MLKSILLALTVALSIFSPAAEPVTLLRKLKLAQPDQGESASRNAALCRYNELYLDRLAGYGRWEYQRVPADGAAALELLESGGVDLLCGIFRTPEYARKFYFPPQPVGELELAVFALDGNSKYIGKVPHEWPFARVGYVGGPLECRTDFEVFARVHMLQYALEKYDSRKALLEALHRGEIDLAALIVSDVPEGLRRVENCGRREFYCAAAPNRPELADALAAAVEKVKIYDQPFLDDIAEKYLGILRPGPERIRVGCYLAPGACEVDEQGRLYGYNIEYTGKVAEYAGWKIDYVRLAFDAALKYLGEGKIDLVCGVGRTPERERICAFAAMPTGVQQAVLAAPGDSPLLPNRYQGWQNITIGLPHCSLAGNQLFAFLREHGIVCKFVQCNDLRLGGDLKSQHIDAVLTFRNLIDKQCRILAAFPPFFTYFCTARDNVRLMQELNRAIEAVKLGDARYESRLLNRYFPDFAPGNVAFSLSELEYLQSREGKKLRIDISPVRHPIKGYDPEGKTPTGFTAVLLNYISSQTGLRFECLEPADAETARARLLAGEADLWVGYSGNIEPLISGGSASDSISIPRVLVYRKGRNIPPPEKARVAVPADDHLLRRFFERDRIGGILLFDTVDDCYAAVAAGEADYTVDSLYAAQHDIWGKKQFRNLAFRYMDANRYDYPYTFVFSPASDPRLYSIFNQCIAGISSEKLNNMLFESSVSDIQIPFISLPGILLLVFGVVVAVLLTVLLLVWRGRRKSRKMVEELNQANREKEHSLFRSELTRNCLELLMTGGNRVKAFADVCEKLGAALDMEYAAIFCYSDIEKSGEVEALAWWGGVPEYNHPCRHNVKNTEHLRTAILEHELMVITAGSPWDYGEANPELAAVLRKTGFSTLIIRHLSVDGRIWGHIALGAGKAVTFDRNDAKLLDIFCRALEIYLAGYESNLKLNLANAMREMIFKASPVALMMFDAQQNLAMLNDRAAQIAGKPKEQLLGERCFHNFCVAPQIRSDCPVAESIRTGRMCSRRLLIRERYYDVIAVPLFENGKLTNVLEALADQTELALSERHFRETSELLSAILNTLPCIVFVKDYYDNDRYLMASDYLNKMLGWTRDYAIGKTDIELFGEAVGQKNREGDAVAMRSGRWEADGVLDQFDARCHHTIKTRVRREDGRDLLLGIGIDISETIRQKNEIEKSRNELQKIALRLENLLAQSTRLRSCLEQLAVNSDMAAMLRRVIQETGKLLGASLYELVRYEGCGIRRVYAWHPLAKREVSLWQGEEARDFIHRIRQKGMVCGFSTRPGEDPKLDRMLQRTISEAGAKALLCMAISLDGELWGHLGFYRDSAEEFSQDEINFLHESARVIEITLLRRRLMREIADKEQKLLQALDDARMAAKVKSMFLATMSHEIRTPLNAVIGFSDFLSRPGVSEAEVKEYTDGISHSAHALLNLINDILDLSKLESGDIDMFSGECDLVKLFDEMKIIFQYSARSKNLSLIGEIDREKFPFLRLNEQRMRQILLNVIGNAVKFTQHGFVKYAAKFVDSGDGRGRLEITVEDTGIGIDPALHDVIFNPFVQETTRGQKVYEGTGLGLPIVKRMVDKLNGTITFTSTLEQGTVFVIRVGNLETATPNKKSETDGNGPAVVLVPPSLRVLLIDDVKLNLKVLALHLKQFNAQCALAGSGGEALEYLAENEVDLIMTDIWMPDMSGAALAQTIRTYPRLANIPIVAVTADADVRDNFDTGAFSAILYKPVTAEKIKAVLADVLQKSAGGGRK